MGNIKTWLGKNWISLSALVIAIASACFAYNQTIITKRIAHLHVEPEVLFKANFKSSPGRPPHFKLTNFGPIKAVQVEIQLYELRYCPDANKIRLAVYGSDTHWKIQELDVNKPEYFDIPHSWYDGKYYLELAALENKKVDDFVMEAYITYRRKSDLKFYKKRSFYFFDSQGKILTENDIIDNKNYKQVLNSVYETRLGQISRRMTKRMSTDILHDLNDD